MIVNRKLHQLMGIWLYYY